MNDQYSELPSVETPEDVAVLYSWANLHGAKYRDFSASRREYRAQLRHRAAEQARDTELQARADVESGAEGAQPGRREEEQSVDRGMGSGRRIVQADAGSSQRASAERVEATRRGDAVARTDSTVRREMRGEAEASTSERRKAALYAEQEARRREFEASEEEELPGKISDPYTPEVRQAATVERELPPDPAIELRPQRLRIERPAPNAAEESAADAEPRPGMTRQPAQVRSGVAALRPVTRVPDAMENGAETSHMPESFPWMSAPVTPPPAAALRRPQGYRPDDASGVRQIYRAPEPQTPAGAAPRPSAAPVVRRQHDGVADAWARETTPAGAVRNSTSRPQAVAPRRDAEFMPDDSRDVGADGRSWTAAPTVAPTTAPAASSRGSGAMSQPGEWREPREEPVIDRRSGDWQRSSDGSGELEDPTPRRRRQDQPGYRMTDSDRAIAAYRQEQGRAGDASRVPIRPVSPQPAVRADAVVASPKAAVPAVPAWLHGQEEEQPTRPAAAERMEAPPVPRQSSAAPGADTLQRSRERVASRWFALKGVFEQPGQERAEVQPVRQKETRTPVLAVFSFAGGVGKTALVATLGRSLSSLGEKVLLTDTTSHGLLPFYFGASELRAGTVRTFSPPSGSTDAPIYMVNYAVDQAVADEAEQTRVAEEIVKSSRGAHRVLLDLTSSTGWMIRRIAYMNPTVLVPLAPDMNSVISLQAIEKFLLGINGPDGTPLKVFYVLAQFDASLPLHLDVREVLRRQLGERLLPFVIRRAPAVSEALAEGMTIVDYAADAPATEDYMNVAGWLRTLAAPATAGFRNVRWSER